MPIDEQYFLAFPFDICPAMQYNVLKHIIKCGGITALEASDEYDITRLSARIYDLRKLGIPIENTRQKSKNGKRFVRYILGD